MGVLAFLQMCFTGPLRIARVFPAFSDMYERLSQGISLCGDFLVVTLNFNLLKLKIYYILINYLCVCAHAMIYV